MTGELVNFSARMRYFLLSPAREARMGRIVSRVPLTVSWLFLKWAVEIYRQIVEPG